MRKKLLAAAAVCLALTGCSLLPNGGGPYTQAGFDVTQEDGQEEAFEETALSSQTETEETQKESGGHTEDGGTDSTAQYTWESGLESSGEVENSIIIATDMHYLAGELADNGPAFTDMVEHGDGKIVTYIKEIMDAFLDEVIARRPGALILSGDITFEGERLSHRELAGLLVRVEEAGIPVLVIPGNHDINNRSAVQYSGIRIHSAEFITPEEFRDIYRDYGYEGAVSYDPASLSYLYRLDESSYLLMLDSCQYEPRNLVGGAIGEDTYDWIESQLERADQEGMKVIPVSHHNLLEESEIYTDDCTIEHGEQLERMLENWGVRIYLSGHLHVQHMKESEGGILEIVTSSLATPPCQYGVLTIGGENSYQYETQKVDMEAWTNRKGSVEPDLLQFTEFREPFLERVFFNQAFDQLAGMDFDPERTRQMAELYARLKAYYYAGRAVEIRDEVLWDPNYVMWDCEVPGSILPQYIQSILDDARMDYNRAVVE